MLIILDNIVYDSTCILKSDVLGWKAQIQLCKHNTISYANRRSLRTNEPFINANGANYIWARYSNAFEYHMPLHLNLNEQSLKNN